MFAALVLYGHPTDPAEFDRYYHTTHLAIAKKMALKGYTITMLGTPNPAEKSPYYMLATLYTESPEEFMAVLGSPEGQAALADTQNFATGGLTLLVGEEQIIIPVAQR